MPFYSYAMFSANIHFFEDINSIKAHFLEDKTTTQPHFSEDKNNGKAHFFEDKNTTTPHFSEDRHKVLELFETSKQLVKRGIKNTEKGAKNNYTRVRDKTQSLCQLPRSAS